MTDKTILIYCEQGFGDCIQFSRYIFLIQKLTNKIVLASKPKLVSLFKFNFPNLTVLSHDDKVPSYDYNVALLDLPKCFKTSIDTIPYNTSYLSVDEGLKTNWKRMLGPKTKLRIGILFTSNSIAYITKFRKVEIDKMLPIISDKFDFINLSVDITDNDVELFKTYNIKTYHNFMGDFYTTAGLVSNLDLVDRKSTRLNSSHTDISRMPSSA